MTHQLSSRLRNAVVMLGALLCLGTTAIAQSPSVQRGLTFVRIHCAQCHAIDKVSDSPLTIALAFRDLRLKFSMDIVRRRLAEGIVAAHPTMPQFRLESDQLNDVMAYLESLQQ